MDKFWIFEQSCDLWFARYTLLWQVSRFVGGRGFKTENWHKMRQPSIRRIRRIDSQRQSLTPLQKYTFFNSHKIFDYFYRSRGILAAETIAKDGDAPNNH